MIDESASPKRSSKLHGKRYRFSLRALIAVTTLVAAGAAIAANYPAIAQLAFLIFLVIVFEIVFPWAFQAVGERLGRSKYRLSAIVVLTCLVGGCVVWSISQRLWPPHVGACFGALFGMVMLVCVMHAKKK